MGFREILEFVKIEHTLFSLPFVLIGYILAENQYGAETSDIFWILSAAVGARGLAMTLNRIIDKDIDAANPRTAERHLVTGTMSIITAWQLSSIFLLILLFSAWKLNIVALMLSWIPVSAFAIYPYTKRYTWLCHFWLGLCLALAPAGAWLAVSADSLGWDAIFGTAGNQQWFPEVFLISMGVAFWIAVFDMNYARMDSENDRENNLFSIPSRFGEEATTRLSVILTLFWLLCFTLTFGFGDSSQSIYILSVAIMATLSISVILSRERLVDFQKSLFRVFMLTGWVILATIIMVEPQSITT
ncbi:MAG: UbiA-like polyprenyltransferase [Candidatus Thermoplasmatota archaeon]|nr:UbiA-like polyprenyltransferase [Candidatus Thermoplasmatota archaeon]|tara:strand:+ start:1871 stop:2773 length:903 start_codon:yes stop_codon:yes gene_type:complete